MDTHVPAPFMMRIITSKSVGAEGGETSDR